MGQKVNPHGLRVGVIKEWDTRWYADKKTFSDFLIEDKQIRDFVKSELDKIIKAAGKNAKKPFDDSRKNIAGISTIEIERKGTEKTTVILNASKPGLVIGSKGAGIEALTKSLNKEFGKDFKVEVKEIRFGPQTDDHDYNFKLKHAKEFLEEGNKVRAYVFFRGRSILFKEQGEVLLLRFANDLEEYGKVDQLPRLDGKKMFLYMSPKKQAIQKKSQQKRDREEAEAEAKANAAVENDTPQNGGLLENAKGIEALLKLKEQASED